MVLTSFCFCNEVDMTGMGWPNESLEIIVKVMGTVSVECVVVEGQLEEAIFGMSPGKFQIRVKEDILATPVFAKRSGKMSDEKHDNNSINSNEFFNNNTVDCINNNNYDDTDSDNDNDFEKETETDENLADEFACSQQDDF